MTQSRVAKDIPRGIKLINDRLGRKKNEGLGDKERKLVRVEACELVRVKFHIILILILKRACGLKSFPTLPSIFSLLFYGETQPLVVSTDVVSSARIYIALECILMFILFFCCVYFYLIPFSYPVRTL